jgi:hypothetical protein
MSACIIELLPLELIEWILLYCEGKIVAVTLPKVSKYFRQITGEDEGIWRSKCGDLNLDVAQKSPEQTWKHYYYTNALNLFPLDGYTLGEFVDFQQLGRVRTGIPGETYYKSINDIRFWFNKDQIFNTLYLVFKHPLPKSWEEQGLSFDLTIDDCKKFMRLKNRNYSTTQNLSQTRVISIAKLKSGSYYTITFVFDPNNRRGATSTLYSITLLWTPNPTPEELSQYYSRICTN